MKWNEKQYQFDDVESPVVYDKTGSFKIVSYNSGSTFYAYFKPKGWPNFGNSVRHVKNNEGHFESFKYDSEDAAKKDCEEFFATFGADAPEDSTL